jgi:hypothetical protein
MQDMLPGQGKQIISLHRGAGRMADQAIDDGGIAAKDRCKVSSFLRMGVEQTHQLTITEMLQRLNQGMVTLRKGRNVHRSRHWLVEPIEINNVTRLAGLAIARNLVLKYTYWIRFMELNLHKPCPMAKFPQA